MMTKLPTDETQELIDYYGEPGTNLVIIDLPYRLRLAWNLQQTTWRTRCHEKIAPQLRNVFESILVYYKQDRIKELGLDIYGGCYQNRTMKDSKDRLSTHAFGISVDLDPLGNPYKADHTQAKFAGKEYEPLIEMMYDNNFISIGHELDYDWMHFQAAVPFRDGKRIRLKRKDSKTFHREDSPSRRTSRKKNAEDQTDQ